MNDQPATTEELKELFGDGFDGRVPAGGAGALGRHRRVEAVAVADEALHEGRLGSRSRPRRTPSTRPSSPPCASGEPATSEAAMDAAEQHRLHIHDRFYDLDHTFHRGLADMYVADPRFTKTYEDLAPGLAAYVRDAIHANADRHACARRARPWRRRQRGLGAALVRRPGERGGGGRPPPP